MKVVKVKYCEINNMSNEWTVNLLLDEYNEFFIFNILKKHIKWNFKILEISFICDVHVISDKIISDIIETQNKNLEEIQKKQENKKLENKKFKNKSGEIEETNPENL